MDKPDRLAEAETVFNRHMILALSETDESVPRAAEKLFEEAATNPELAMSMVFLFLAYTIEATMRGESPLH